MLEIVMNDHQIHFLLERLKRYDRMTYDHSIRVAEYAQDAADLFELPEDQKECLVRSALLHDIGKLNVPVDILNKAETLQDEEWECIKKHPQLGVDMLEEWIKDGRVDKEIILYHHENLDGSGYYGILEDNLSLAVRIVRVVESIVGMNSESNYKHIKEMKDTFEELYRWQGVHFDPEVVETLYAHLVKLDGTQKTPDEVIIAKLQGEIDFLRRQLYSDYNKSQEMNSTSLLRISELLDQKINSYNRIQYGALTTVN